MPLSSRGGQDRLPPCPFRVGRRETASRRPKRTAYHPAAHPHLPAPRPERAHLLSSRQAFGAKGGEMTQVAQLWQVQAGDPDAYLAFVQRSAGVRRPYGLSYQIVLKTGVNPREFTCLLVWNDQASYERWKASPERREMLEEGSRLRVGEPRRLYQVVMGPD